MNKATVLTVIALLVLLAACGGKQMAAKPLAKSSTPTGDVVHSTAPTTIVKPTTQDTSSGKTAAEALKEMQQAQLQQTAASVPKTGVTVFSAPANASIAKTKGDARKLLLARTRAAFKTGEALSTAVKASTASGPRYHSSSGEVRNLPKDY